MDNLKEKLINFNEGQFTSRTNYLKELKRLYQEELMVKNQKGFILARIGIRPNGLDCYYREKMTSTPVKMESFTFYQGTDSFIIEHYVENKGSVMSGEEQIMFQLIPTLIQKVMELSGFEMVIFVTNSALKHYPNPWEKIGLAEVKNKDSLIHERLLKKKCIEEISGIKLTIDLNDAQFFLKCPQKIKEDMVRLFLQSDEIESAWAELTDGISNKGTNYKLKEKEMFRHIFSLVLKLDQSFEYYLKNGVEYQLLVKDKNLKFVYSETIRQKENIEQVIHAQLKNIIEENELQLIMDIPIWELLECFTKLQKNNPRLDINTLYVNDNQALKKISKLILQELFNNDFYGFYNWLNGNGMNNIVSKQWDLKTPDGGQQLRSYVLSFKRENQLWYSVYYLVEFDFKGTISEYALSFSGTKEQVEKQVAEKFAAEASEYLLKNY